VEDNEALGQVFSDYFGFPCQFSIHRLPTLIIIIIIIIIINHQFGTIGQIMADVPSELIVTPPPRYQKN
jgi:hypothetical protein